MGRGNERGGVERCTFCEKSRSEVQSLIAGPPGIYICNECVDICNSILREETRRVAQVATESSTLPTEIPTPRWTAYEAKRFSVEMPDYVPMVTTERAYTSPIWYTPGAALHISSDGD